MTLTLVETPEPFETFFCELIGGLECGNILERFDAPDEIVMPDDYRYRKTGDIVNGVHKYQISAHPPAED